MAAEAPEKAPPRITTSKRRMARILAPRPPVVLPLGRGSLGTERAMSDEQQARRDEVRSGENRRRGARGRRPARWTGSSSCSSRSMAAARIPSRSRPRWKKRAWRQRSIATSNDPRGVGVLGMHEDPAFFVTRFRESPGRRALRRPHPAAGADHARADLCLRLRARPRGMAASPVPGGTVLNPAWPWAIW